MKRKPMWRVTVMREFTVQAASEDKAREEVLYRHPFLEAKEMAIIVEPVESEFG